MVNLSGGKESEMMGNEGNKVGMTTSATVSTTTASAPKEVVKREEFAVPALPSRLRPVVKKKRPRTVLKEETYTDALEKVRFLQKAFYPQGREGEEKSWKGIDEGSSSCLCASV